MKRYREFMSRGECLLNALLSCVVPALQALIFALYWVEMPPSGQVLMVLLLLLELGACAFHWYRYLAYDKK